MTGIIHSVIGKFENRLLSFLPLPPVDTPEDKTILRLWFFLALSQMQQQMRDSATLASLGLSGRIFKTDSPFIQWIRSSNESEAQVAEHNPKELLISSQYFDLIRKVIVSFAFYVTQNISFYSALTNLLSHSEKASKVVQPILERAAALPLPRLLQASRVIIFAPVIVKLIYIVLIQIDPKGERPVLEFLKTGADRTSQALEFLWNLRFSLLCLGISKTVYQSVISTIYSMLVHRFIPFPMNMILPHLLSNFITPLKDNPSQLNYFLHLICGNDDYFPTTGFSLGVDGMMVSLYDPSGPYDIATLEKLFNEINDLKTKAEIEPVIQVLSNISSALMKGIISEDHATRLRSLIFTKIHSDFKDLYKADNLLVPADLMNPHYIVNLKTLLDRVNNLTIEIMSEEIIRTWDSDISSALTKGKISEDHATRLKSLIFTKIPAFKPLDEAKFLDAKLETSLMAIHGKNGLIHRFTVTQEDSDKAYLISEKLHLQRFNLNLAWYLQNKPMTVETQKKCELLLIQQAMEARLDYNRIGETESFKKYRQMFMRHGASLNITPQSYVKASKEYRFVKTNLTTVFNDFKFVTFTLPYLIYTMGKDVGLSARTLTKPVNFPAPWSEQWKGEDVPTESKKDTLKEAQELKDLLKADYGLTDGQDPVTFFVSSHAMREAARRST